MPQSNDLPKPDGYDTWTDDQRKRYDGEIDRYRLLAAKIYEQNEGKHTRAELNSKAKQTLADVTGVFPDLDKKVINSFLASIATLTGMILATPLHDLPEILEHTFDANMLAVAANLGIVDLDAEGGPTVEDIVKEHIREDEEKLADESTPMGDLGNIVGPYL